MSRHKKYLFTIIFLFFLSACSLIGSEDNQDPSIARGKNLFLQYCSACHDIGEDSTKTGPSLVHIATDAKNRVAGMDGKTYIEQSVLSPNEYLVEGFDDLMPKTFNNLLAQEEIDFLIAYLLSLE